ncbi:MAG: O-antigen ligase family protein [Spirochaetia bacterium]|nr:O-antigen ligase family protein [Spirochaetota bacterium]MDW8113068.1 O-antigen ligase family protein [Spirochaetia bacterium]
MLERFVNTSVFNIFFVISFMMLMFSQLLVIPILLFLFLFIVYLKRFRESFSLEDIIFYVFILLSGLSILVARNREVAIGGVLILILYYIVFYVGRNAKIRDDILFVSTSLGFVMLAIFGVVFYIFPEFSLIIGLGKANIIEIPSSLIFTNDSIIRSTSITPNPVIYSSVVLYSIPILVSMLLVLSNSFSRNVDVKLFLLLALVVFLIGVVIFTSGSRSILLISPVSLILVFLILKKNRQILMSIILFVIVITPVVIFSEILDRIESIFTLTDYSSFLNRLDAIRLSLGILKDNWLIGVGFVNFKEYVPSYYGNYLHNLYLSILVETGILGFLSFIALISVALYKSFRNVILGRVDYIKLGAFVSVICFLLHGLIDNTMYVVSLGMMFWFFLGLSCRGDVSADEKLVENTWSNSDSRRGLKGISDFSEN